MALEYFPCYHSYRKKIAKLSDQEVGRLFRSLLTYSETGETQELTGRESVAYDFIADDIDRAKAAYEAKCEKNRRNRTSTNDNERQRPSSNVDKTKTKDKSKTKTESKIKDIFAAFAAGDADLLASLTGFEEMRKKIKSPMTDRAKSMMAKKLTQMSGGDHSLMIALLDQSTMNGWKDIYALKQPLQKASSPDYSAYAEDSL